MKAKEIRDLTTDELHARLKDEKDRLLRLRLNHAVSAIESPAAITGARKTIARIKTVLREREMAEKTNQ